MSRTDKDAPYWVRLNNEGGPVHHDHLSFGKPIRANRPVLDERGEEVWVNEPIYLTARQIKIRNTWPGKYFSPEILAEADRYTSIWSNSRYYNPDKMILTGYRRYRKLEMVTIGYVADHCTEGEPAKNREDAGWWSSEMPCTPELPRGKRSKMYVRGMSKARKGYSKARNGHSRVQEKIDLTEAMKDWNAGYEVDTPLELTAQHRHSMNWDLW